MQLRTAWTALAIACALAGCAHELPVDSESDAGIAVDDGKGDGAGATFTAAEVRGMLRVANELSAADLVSRVGLTRAVADAIVAYRFGADRTASTGDDNPFDTLAELDALPAVGPQVLAAIRTYARSAGWVPEFRLPGFDETMLVAGNEGQLAVLRVGSTWSRVPISTRNRRAPLLAKSDGQKFYLLYASGSLAIVDPGTARVERTLSVPSGPSDFDWASPTSIFVARQRAGIVAEVDLASGAVRREIRLASVRVGDGTIELRRILVHAGRLFVQVARQRRDGRPDRGAVAVVDIASGNVVGVVELQLPNPTTGAMVAGLEPDFPMVWDPQRDVVMVTARGSRPVDTGMLVNIHATRLQVVGGQRAASGFQGSFVFGPPFTTLFMLFHTSTPTASSHLFSYRVAADGTLTSAPGTVVDTFDERDELAINDAGTLVVMPNECVAGICPTGSGLNFVDARTRAALPKLLADDIGFSPAIAVFR